MIPIQFRSSMLVRNIQFCLSYWTKKRQLFAAHLICIAIYCFVLSISPVVLSAATDSLVERRENWLFVVAALLATYAVVTATRLISIRLWNVLEVQSVALLVSDLFAKVLSMNLQWYTSARFGAVMRVMSRGYHSYHTFGDLVFQRLLVSILVAGFTVAIGFFRSPIIGATFLLGILGYAAGSLFYASWKVLPLRLKSVGVDSALSAEIADSFACFPFIKMSAREEAEKARIGGILLQWREAFTKSWSANVTAEALQDGTLLILKCAVVCWGAFAVAEGRAAPGAFVFLISTFFVLETQLNDLARSFQQATRAVADIQEVLELTLIPGEASIAALPSPADDPGPLGMDIEVRDVTFSYEGHRPVLHNVSFHIGAGESVAIVGPSGAGKTTLLGLLLGVLRPSSGRILIGGADIAGLPTTAYRARIAVVPQEPTVFDRSIADNILYLLDQEQHDAEILLRAVTNSNLEEVIQNSRDGIEARIGARGMLLSGGQRQRVAIARAIASGRNIVLLDEATSALDATNEEYVLQRLLVRPSQRTALVVTHRLAALRKVDRVLVVRGGTVEQYDDPADFLSRHSNLVTATVDDHAESNAGLEARTSDHPVRPASLTA